MAILTRQRLASHMHTKSVDNRYQTQRNEGMEWMQSENFVQTSQITYDFPLQLIRDVNPGLDNANFLINKMRSNSKDKSRPTIKLNITAENQSILDSVSIALRFIYAHTSFYRGERASLGFQPSFPLKIFGRMEYKTQLRQLAKRNNCAIWLSVADGRNAIGIFGATLKDRMQCESEMHTFIQNTIKDHGDYILCPDYFKHNLLSTKANTAFEVKCKEWMTHMSDYVNAYSIPGVVWLWSPDSVLRNQIKSDIQSMIQGCVTKKIEMPSLYNQCLFGGSQSMPAIAPVLGREVPKSIRVRAQPSNESMAVWLIQFENTDEGMDLAEEKILNFPKLCESIPIENHFKPLLAKQKLRDFNLSFSFTPRDSILVALTTKYGVQLNATDFKHLINRIKQDCTVIKGFKSNRHALAFRSLAIQYQRRGALSSGALIYVADNSKGWWQMDEPTVVIYDRSSELRTTFEAQCETLKNKHMRHLNLGSDARLVKGNNGEHIRAIKKHSNCCIEFDIESGECYLAGNETEMDTAQKILNHITQFKQVFDLKPNEYRDLWENKTWKLLDMRIHSQCSIEVQPLTRDKLLIYGGKDQMTTAKQMFSELFGRQLTPAIPIENKCCCSVCKLKRKEKEDTTTE